MPRQKSHQSFTKVTASVSVFQSFKLLDTWNVNIFVTIVNTLTAQLTAHCNFFWKMCINKREIWRSRGYWI